MLELQGIETGYGGSVVVRGVKLRVKDGQVVCLMGRNGVGKTTLMKSVMGVLPLSRGSVYFAGHDISGHSPARRARLGIGYVPQGREIFPHLTVRENLLLGLEASSEKEIDREVYEHFPVLAQIGDRRGGNLSGGQQQQLAIARALVSRPRFLLLDEPTEGIQPSIVADIREVIRKLKGRCSILLVEQSFDFARSITDYFYIMDKGSVVCEGEADCLTESEVAPYLGV